MTNANPPARILIVDDDAAMAAGVADYLGQHGYDTVCANGGAQALRHFESSVVDAVITDLRMSSMDGFDLLGQLKQLDATVPVFIMTGFGTIENAIEAVKRGAFHYFSKPLKVEEVRIYLDRALQQRRLEQSRRRLLRDASDRYSVGALVARTKAMRQVCDLIERVAEGNASVLITGESGTGKELVARAIHYLSPRRDNAFVLLNCTAIPATLLESELFGHEKGAFTGANRARVGLAAEAAGGTLFLDEIGDLQLELQPKLLRLLQEGEIRSVGSDKTRRVDVRVISATHANLDARIAQGTFRSDLYYRLNVVPVHLPPLRERPEDIPILAERLLEDICASNPHLAPATLTRPAHDALLAYAWPGNVRELRNVLERACTLSRGGKIDAEHIAFLRGGSGAAQRLPDILADEPSLRTLEARYIAHVMEQTGRNKVKAAAILGVDPSTLYRRGRAKS